MRIRFLIALSVGMFFLAVSADKARAGNDPSIKGALRAGVQASMGYFIESRTVDGKFHLYDPIDNKLLALQFKELHEGIVKKGDFYVSCADFVDQKGRKMDLDFLVVPDGDALRTIQAVLHSIEGKKRKYHLESK